jgi:hypothetical protein
MAVSEVFCLLDDLEHEFLDDLRLVTGGDDEVAWFCLQWARARDRETHLISEDIRLSSRGFVDEVVGTYSPEIVLLFGQSPRVKMAEQHLHLQGVPVIRVPTYAR